MPHAAALSQENNAKTRVTIAMIQKAVAGYYEMTIDELLERTRRRAVAHPRQIAMYLAVTDAKKSLPYTGCRFGKERKFDHTTVMHARNVVARKIEADPDFANEVQRIRARYPRTCRVLLS